MERSAVSADDELGGLLEGERRGEMGRQRRLIVDVKLHGTVCFMDSDDVVFLVQFDFSR